MAKAEKDKDPGGCLSCAAVLFVIAVLIGVGGLIGSGSAPTATWIFLALAAISLVFHRLDPKTLGKSSAAKPNLPPGWVSYDTTVEIAQLWNREADMFDATQYRNVWGGRAHKHVVALVTPTGGRSTGHYLVIKLNTDDLPDFDWMTNTPSPTGLHHLDQDFFDELNTITTSVRPCGIRNGCFWIEVADYADANPAQISNPYADLINDYDKFDSGASGSAAATSGGSGSGASHRSAAPTPWPPPQQTAPPMSGGPTPVSSDQLPPPQLPAPTAAWPTLPSYSTDRPAPGQPMALEAVDAVDSSGPAISGKAKKSMPKFEEPDEWTVQQWKPSSQWKPDTSWTPPSYTPSQWEAPSGSSLFGAPSSLSPEDDSSHQTKGDQNKADRDKGGQNKGGQNETRS